MDAISKNLFTLDSTNDTVMYCPGWICLGFSWHVVAHYKEVVMADLKEADLGTNPENVTLLDYGTFALGVLERSSKLPISVNASRSIC